MYNCPVYGSDLHWESDSKLSDYTGEELDEDHDKLIQSLYCPNCMLDVEITFPSEAEKQEAEQAQSFTSQPRLSLHNSTTISGTPTLALQTG